jgi:hypothetical protein
LAEQEVPTPITVTELIVVKRVVKTTVNQKFKLLTLAIVRKKRVARFEFR